MPALTIGAMEIRLTIADPGRLGAQVDVAVRAEPGTPLSAVQAELVRAVGLDPAGAPSLHCDGAILAVSAPLGVHPLLDGAMLTAGPAGTVPGTMAGTASAALDLHVIAGPEAGTVAPLPPGTWRLGRSPGTEIRLDDPDVSRLHAEFEVAAGAVRLRDLDSTNGTSLDGTPIPPGVATPVGAGQRIRIGRNLLVIRGPDGMPACCVPDGEGHDLVNRAPRMGAPSRAVRVDYPRRPAARSRPRIPWPAILLPAVVAVPMAMLWRQPALLLLGLLGPLGAVAQVAVDRRRAGRDEAADSRSHDAAADRADAALAAALSADLSAREDAHPDLALLARTAAGPTARLWERRIGDPDALVLRIGRGRVPSAVQVHRPADPLDGGSVDAVDEPADHPDAPVCVDLRELPILGVCGSRSKTLGVLRAVIGELAVLHSPGEVRVVLLGDEKGPDWSWLRWLPHATGAEALDGTGEKGLGPEPHLPDPHLPDPHLPDPHLVVIVDGRDRWARSPLAEPSSGRAGRLSAICVEVDAAALPLQCSATLTVDDDDGAVLRRRGGAEQSLVAESAREGWSHRLARHLAPLRDATAAGAGSLPRSVRLPPLLGRVHGVDPVDPAQVARLWSLHQPGPKAVLGVGGHGPCLVDLDTDGPHLLVAGTTGAGKSELLQCLVASLATANSPQELCFVLVDYKGGSAFAGCAPLPHVTGLVTDLDRHLTGRALRSLAAELRRRETLLRSAATGDLAGYHAARNDRPSLPPLPRLVLVVDEFRVLAEELPDFVSGLVRIATVGRSLGVHLVLATQRPAGVVSAEIRANVNLRIALRVRDPEDSRDVVDAVDAAELPGGIPGRALLRTGGGPLVQVQVAHASAPHLPEGPTVHRIGADHSEIAAPPPAGTATDLARLVQAARGAADHLGLPPVPPPWLPPLPERLTLSELDADGRSPEAAHRTELEVPFGLADHPERQRQTVIGWCLDGGSHLAVVGGPRSGRTTALLTIAVSAARQIPPRRLHLHAITGSDEFLPLIDLPHTGTITPVRDRWRVGRLLALLVAEVAERRSGPGLTTQPTVLLLVDGWEAVSEASGPGQRVVDDLVRLLRDGAAVGVRLAVSGGRSLLTGQIGGLLGERLVLRMADPLDAALAGIPAGVMPDRMPPGAAVRTGGDDPGGTLTQIATVDGGTIETITGGADASAGRPGAWRIQELPLRVDRRRLARGRDPRRDPRRVPIGLGDDDLSLLHLDLVRAPGQLVLGAPGTGRSSALATVGAGLLEAGERLVVIAAPTSPAAALAALGAQLLDPLADNPPTALPAGLHLLVDDAPFLGPLMQEWLLHRAVEAAGHAGAVIAVAETCQALAAYRGLLVQLRRHRSGLLLGPYGPGDGEAFGSRLPPAERGGPAQPPGRGLVVRAGEVSAVQVAEPSLHPVTSLAAAG